MSHRARAAEYVGLGVLLLALLDYLRPDLLLAPTISAGGDTPCHYPTAVAFAEYLLPRGRLHGWNPGAYLGQPLLLYYFPLPFLVIAGLAPVLGMPAAFKVGSVLGVFLLPVFAYVAFRLLSFRAPTALLAAVAAYVFLFVEDNPIWGGTLASTLAGEFAYEYGIGLALLSLAVCYRTYSRGGSFVPAAICLAVTSAAHGYAVLWAGLSASYFLYGSRLPGKTLAWLVRVGLLAFCLAGLWLVPLLQSWGYTTPYNDAWISVGATNLLPPLLWPLFALAVLGPLSLVVVPRFRAAVDHRVLFLLHAAAMACALGLGGEALGIIGVRFAPFAQLSLALVGAASLGLVAEDFSAAPLGVMGLLLLSIAWCDSQSRVVRYWAEYNFTGLEAKPLWPAYRSLARELHGTPADPRVAVEYSKEHEKGGSIRLYETLPFFSGRSTLEGVYNQASILTHEVYYLASELDEVSPNPFRSRPYSTFDLGAALEHLRLFDVRDIVALSPKLKDALARSPDVEQGPEIPPYSLFRIKDTGYVVPVRFEPVRSSPRGFPDKAFRWFTRKPLSGVPLVFTRDERFPLERDPWLPPQKKAIDGDFEVRSVVERESITIETPRVGHPLLVKVAYHPRWRTVGADGPYLVAPGMMLVVPREKTVRLEYVPDLSDHLGRLLSVAGLAFALWPRRGAPRKAATGEVLLDFHAPPTRRWGGLLPGGLILVLALSSLFLRRNHDGDIQDLYARASQAYVASRFADASDYAQDAIQLSPPRGMRLELLCLRAEGLLHAGDPAAAAAAFEQLLSEPGENPYAAEALFGLSTARKDTGELQRAEEARSSLLAKYPDSVWSRRATPAR